MTTNDVESQRAKALQDFLKDSEELDARLREAGKLLGRWRPAELDYDRPEELRPIDWRWRRICDLDRRKLPPDHPQDDDWVRRGVAFKVRQRYLHDSGGLDGLAAKFPDIHGAVEIMTSYASLARDVLQARLLAGFSEIEAAHACDLTARGVFAFKALFFEIGHLRSTPGMLASKLLPLDPVQEFADGNPGPILKLLGITHDRETLEAGIRILVDKSEEDDDRRKVLPLLIRLTRNNVMHKAAAYGLGPPKLGRGMCGVMFMAQKIIPYLTDQA